MISRRWHCWAGAESSPLVKRVQKAADVVVEMGEGARAILSGRPLMDSKTK